MFFSIFGLQPLVRSEIRLRCRVFSFVTPQEFP